MAGTNSGLVLQPRDYDVLRELHVTRVMYGDQFGALGLFHSRTRINARLLALTRAGLIARRQLGIAAGGQRCLYALSARGARLINVPVRSLPWNPHSTLAWSPALEHQLAVTNVYVALRRAARSKAIQLAKWMTFTSPLAGPQRLIPDAFAELELDGPVRAVFFEIDRATETLRVWRKKIAAYLAFAASGAFADQFHHATFRVAVTTPSARRLESLRTCIASTTDKLFWLTSSRPDEAFTQPLWLRPRGDDFTFLL